jgi:teichuronic acid biosynthesis glycosyltransferase TuaG
MKEVKVSVIMPAYNAQHEIVTAMESVIRQTTTANVELLVVEDCSTDETRQVIRQFLEHYEQTEHRTVLLLENKENLGVAKSRNKAIAAAGGDYVAFLDADDWWDETKLHKQLSLIEKRHQENKDTVLCCTGRELMSAQGESLGKMIGVPEQITFEMLLRTNYIPCSSVLLKREVALEFPMVHDELHEDYLLWLSVLKKYGAAAGLNEPLLKSRMSAGGKSRNKFKSAKMQYGVYRLIGFGVVKSMRYMISYMVNGVRKYR